MSDLFQKKSVDYDANDRIKMRSLAISTCIKENIQLHDQMQIMDFGAGTGLISTQLVPYVKQITAIDISESMLQKLIQKTELNGKVQILCQDLIQEPTGIEYDLIVSAMALHHIEDTVSLIKRFHEHLKLGGQIAIADLDTEPGTFHSKGTEGIFHFGFNRDTLKKIFLGNGFSQIEFFTAHTEVKENVTYPIFLAVATK
jgi:2-polyprenyl-3-methyl-5-hydroxy-6-metoxy-1,4-benzoquinol methylase